MAKQINLEYDGVKYTLEYTRKSVETIEREGFMLNDVESKPGTMIPLLICGAYLHHHPSLSESKIMEIHENLGNKYAFVKALVEMYSEPLEVLVSDEGKNGMWEKTW